jgi:dihydropteroate synthase
VTLLPPPNARNFRWPSFWQVGPGRRLPLDQPRLMGILNVTPDSFSDGGSHRNADEATEAALRMLRDGACIIDVGGESTRPGAQPVNEDEQIRRTAPVIASIRRKADAQHTLISIDTTRSAVAAAALDAGANIINDTSAGRDDEQMLPLASSCRCGLILMHRRSLPTQDQFSHQYDAAPDYGGDVVEAVRSFLFERCRVAVAAGIDPACIVIDPGLGFGKSVEQNYELVARFGDLAIRPDSQREVGTFPLLSAASRKSFIGVATGEDVPAKRVMGSVAITVAHYLMGVRLFRVHDVHAHRQALAVADIIGGFRRQAQRAF